VTLTLADLKAPGAYLRAPRIGREEVRLLWHADFWDGPRSGLLRYRGELCWFEVVVDNDDPDLEGWYRRFAVLRLSKEQLVEEQYRHELFRQKVGTHTDYEEPVGAVQPQDHHEDFYTAYRQRKPRDFSRNAVLGWFEE
jgi:hypothetical protein